jgi:hypothetical protein
VGVVIDSKWQLEMDMNDNWIEAEIARELDRLGPEDLEDSNHEKENIFNDFLLKFKPPQYTTATQSSYMARYLSLRNEQHNLIREELGIPPSSDEDGWYRVIISFD